jgi:hypothetical protein
MRFLLSILLIAVFGFIAGLFLPWWSIAIVAFLVLILLPQGLGRSFLAGFLGIFIMWFLVALIQDLKNDHILSRKIAELFKLGPASVLLIFITALIGGLVAGFAAISGSSLRPFRK